MPRGAIGLQFEGWEDYMAKLDEIGGTKLMRSAVEECLYDTQKYVNVNLKKSIKNLPL